MIANCLMYSLPFERILVQSNIPYNIAVNPIKETIIITVTKWNQTYKVYITSEGYNCKESWGGKYSDITTEEFYKKCKELYRENNEI